MAVATGATARRRVLADDGQVTSGVDTPRMGLADEERTGTLVLRAWVEGHGEKGLRVRITRTVQGRTNEPVTSASATIDGVCAIVRAWLEELLGGMGPLPPSGRQP